MSEYHASIAPTLSVKNGIAAVEFYKKAFNAVEIMRVSSPDGEIVAELSIDGANFFVADESPSNERTGPVAIRMGLFVADPDSIANSAVAAGAKLLFPVADQDYGYRLGAVEDPYGHVWEIARKL